MREIEIDRDRRKRGCVREKKYKERKRERKIEGEKDRKREKKIEKEEKTVSYPVVDLVDADEVDQQCDEDAQDYVDVDAVAVGGETRETTEDEEREDEAEQSDGETDVGDDLNRDWSGSQELKHKVISLLAHFVDAQKHFQH